MPLKAINFVLVLSLSKMIASPSTGAMLTVPVASAPEEAKVAVITSSPSQPSAVKFTVIFEPNVTGLGGSDTARSPKRQLLLKVSVSWVVTGSRLSSTTTSVRVAVPPAEI